MKKVYEEYLSVLRAFVQDCAPDTEKIGDPDELIHLAYINSTPGLVSCTFMKYPDLMPSVLVPQLRKLCLNSIAHYADRAESMKTLAQELDRNGIDVLLFKGFVVREYYPVPELRSFGDIDFVIRPEDRERCDALMKKLGYETHVSWEPVNSYVKDTEYYEIHTSVMTVNVSDRADYIGYFGHIWEHAQPSTVIPGAHIYEFTPEFHFLYLVTHIAKHISGSGAGVRMYLDIAFFLKHYGSSLDWARIRNELETLHLTDFCNVVFTAVKDWFGVPSPIPLRPVDAQIMEEFLEYTVEGGTFGKTGRDNSVVYLKQQNRGTGDVPKLKTLLYHAFPPRSELQDRYSYVQKHGWLLPAAWVHRIADSRKEWGRFASDTKNIIKAKPDDVLRLKRICKNIGL